MKLKKIGAALIALCLVLVLLPLKVSAVDHKDIRPSSNSCGDYVTWELKGDTLTISGTGEMWDNTTVFWYVDENGEQQLYRYSGIPWRENSSSIKKIIISEGVTRIAGSAFRDCYNLSSISLPDSLTSIGDSSFTACDSLTSITIPKNVRKIESWAFCFCGNLTNVTLPDGVTDIGESAFRGTKLRSISIPDSVKTIGEYAFSNVPLKSVTLPKNLTTIEANAFSGDHNLNSITIPSNVTTIRRDAFRSCGSLANVTIPASVTSIEVSAFEGCSKLSTVNYGGTEAQWKAITIGLNNEALTKAKVIYNNSGSNTPDTPSEPTAPAESTIVVDRFTLALPGLDKNDYNLTIKEYGVSQDISPVDVENFQEFLADKGTVEEIYDIHLETADGDPYAGGMVTITLKMQLDPTRNYTVYHQGDNRALSTRRQGNTALQFRTNRFSLYAVVSTPKPASSTSSRSSGGSSMVGFTSYVITAKAGAGGSISSPGETRYDAGTNVTYTITPNAGYAVDKVIVDGKNEVALTNGTYTFRLLNQPYTIEATFKPVSGAAQPSAPAAAAPNPATGDSWFTHLFF